MPILEIPIDEIENPIIQNKDTILQREEAKPEPVFKMKVVQYEGGDKDTGVPQRKKRRLSPLGNSGKLKLPPIDNGRFSMPGTVNDFFYG